ncbi:hypothetical protein FOCG_18199 [Fusarium oxysporum f. sp. radicis-lycopersici 26381]|nr:hypothetical protein FOWG_17135 [Fusarium oxysporum f. sp. lycopersici MN25]EXL39187.1 hypothetical protein FOCG_18199 [Fusarium oxysporum f. sp. radicis-lycopersici 26381]
MSQPSEQARLAPRPQLPEQAASILEPKLIPRCPPRPTVRLYYMARVSQQPLCGRENGQQRAPRPGRPAKYASREEKAAADNARARNKRRAQRQMELYRQAENPFRFYQFTQ